jgi:uncharacterized protein (TIGR02001 family)
LIAIGVPLRMLATVEELEPWENEENQIRIIPDRTGPNVADAAWLFRFFGGETVVNIKTFASNLVQNTRSTTAALMVFGLAFANAASAEELNLSYGADLTSNYIAKGFTQTDNGPAFQPYIEFAYGPAYLTFWGSNASFGGVKDVELDVGIGLRPDIDPFDLDFGYVQYFYDKDNTDYGEAFVKIGYGLTDTSQIKLSYWREVYSEYNTFYLGGSVSELPWDLTLSGGVGSDFGSRKLSEDAFYADIGLTKGLSDNFSIDVRGNYSAIEGSILTVKLSLYN